MSARPERVVGSQEHLRVLKGRKVKRPSIAPWTIMALVGITAFLGLVFARTSLDQSAFELAELNDAIVQETTMNRDLKLQIAEMENPARIAPLAEEMGLVIPGETRQLLVNLTPSSHLVQADDSEGTQ